MAGFFGRAVDFIKGKDKTYLNAFNKAFYEFMGGKPAQYDYDRKTYLKQGYGHNPDVYSIIKQQADKIKAVPYEVKKVKDKESERKYYQLENATKGVMSISQLKRKLQYKADAFDKDVMPFPLYKPNANQTWAQIWELYQVFMQTTGNFYLYMESPEDGANKGVPTAVYVLPSHLIQIVLKENADLVTDESVIDHYVLTEGNQYITFPEEDVIHVSTANPFFSFDGAHLYGMSPLMPLLRNIESSNDALDQNVKTMKNGGVFGFIHAREGKTPLTPEQALQMKEKLKQMDRDPSRLSNIAGSSAPLAFTKLSLNTNELQPFEFLDYDQKIIANALGWDIRLLNNKDGGGLGRNDLEVIQRNVIINTIIPSLKVLQGALTNNFLPRFKGYENTRLEWDYTELPEMQKNIKEMLDGYKDAYLTPNETRQLVNFEPIEAEGMNDVWIDGNKRRIDEAALSEEEINRAFEN